jgi:hypothetical protein
MRNKMLILLTAVMLTSGISRAQLSDPYLANYSNNVISTVNNFNDTYYGINSPDSLTWILRIQNEAYNFPNGYNLLVYPNPATSGTRVVLPAPAIGTAYVDVIDLNGNVDRSYQYAPGSYELDVDISNLPVSIYSVRVYGTGIGFYNLKVVKQ